jgi:hypothetical protein
VVVVTSPTGIYTNAGTSGTGDAVAVDTWMRTNVRNNGSVGITSEYARSGNGSIWFEGTKGPGGASSKADMEYYFGTPFALSSLTSLLYDWYRDGASTASTAQHPVIRLYYDADGSTGTTGDRGYLIFERAYNGGGAAPTDQWVTESITGSTHLWLTQFGHPVDEVYTRTLNNYITGYTPTAGYAQITRSSLIYGVSVGIGSGWGPFEGAVDNITVGVNGVQTTYNFELAGGAVPEPGTCALLGGGILLLALRRRR